MPQFWCKTRGNVVNIVGLWYSYIWTGIVRLDDKNQSIRTVHLFSERPSYFDLVISSDLLDIYLWRDHYHDDRTTDLTWWQPPLCHTQGASSLGTDTFPCQSKLLPNRWRHAPLYSALGMVSHHGPKHEFLSKGSHWWQRHWQTKNCMHEEITSK